MSLKLKHWGSVLKGCRMCLELAKTKSYRFSLTEKCITALWWYHCCFSTCLFFLSLIVLLFRFEYDIFRDLKFLCRFLIKISEWWILHSVMGMGFCWLPLPLDEDTASDVDLEHRLSLKICLGWNESLSHL